MPRGIALVVLLVSAVAQCALFAAIAFNRAGGWGSPVGALAMFCLLAGLPIGLLAAKLLQASSIRLSSATTVPFLLAISVGLLFPTLALVEYGHGSPFMLLLGFLFQWFATLTAWRRLKREA